MLTRTLSVIGMKCVGCVAKLTSALAAEAGVEKVVVSLEKGMVTLRYDEAVTGLGPLRSIVNGVGYGIDDLKMRAGDGCKCGLFADTQSN
jgi:copper chaperone CopZ